MDILTLASTAFVLAKPFLEKTQEGVARKVGEDIWNLIKTPFTKKGKNQVEALANTDQEVFKKELEQYLLEDETFAKQLSELINQSQNLLSGNFQQNINSYDKVEKQINIQTNSGTIQM